jgi:hypothetical protein
MLDNMAKINWQTKYNELEIKFERPDIRDEDKRSTTRKDILLITKLTQNP